MKENMEENDMEKNPENLKGTNMHVGLKSKFSGNDITRQSDHLKALGRWRVF